MLNSFLQFLEQDDSESLIVGATNLEGLLDDALYRRFDDVIRYHLPSEAELRAAQRDAMARVDAEVDGERDRIERKSAEVKKKHDAQVECLALGLREARQSAGLSLTQLAERTGMTRQAISRIESGENRNPTVSTIVRLAEALNKECVIELHDEA